MKNSYLQVAVESCSKISRVISIIYIQGPPKGYKHYHYPVQTPKVPSGLLDQMLKMVELLDMLISFILDQAPVKARRYEFV